MQKFRKIRKKTKKNFLSGFLLLEMLVSMLIFSLVILASVAAFISVIKTQKKTRETQKKVESVGITMGLMNKVIRMSSQVKSYNSNREIRMYNSSQNKCISYRFNIGNHNLEEADSTPATNYNPNTDNGCTLAGAYSNYTTIIPEVTGRFKIDESTPNATLPHTGKATVTIQIGQEHLQSSVSFMDTY